MDINIWKKNSYLNVVCENSKTGERLQLHYSLLDTDVCDRWINLINKNNEAGNSLRYNYRKILSMDEIEDQFVIFQNNINFINSRYDRKLTTVDSVEQLKQNESVLNDLHEEFEIYGDRLEEFIAEGYFNNPKGSAKYNPIWPGDAHDKVLHESFLILNEQIHNFEAIYRTWDRREKSICTCLVDFMPAGLHEDLKPEDYLLFDPEHKWGWIYLGYNTLGKHWSSACNDNDIEVVMRKQIRPQARFAAETYMSFRYDTPYYSRISLYKWWMDNNFSEIIDPTLKLSELALGFIPVGALSSYTVADGTKTFITPDINTDDWNKNIWSKFNKIVGMKIINI